MKTKKNRSVSDSLLQHELDKKLQIDDIIANIQDEMESIDICSDTKIIEDKKNIIVDINQLEEDCKKESAIFLKDIVQFYGKNYLDQLSTDFYIISKMKEDQEILSDLKFQSKIAKISTQKLIENILSDQLYFRNYEGIRNLQQSVLEIIRHIIQIERIMEDFYKYYFKTLDSESGGGKTNQISDVKKDRLILSSSELIEMYEVKENSM